MDDTSCKAFLVDPLLGADVEFVLRVSKVIVNFVTPNALQKMQQEYVNDHLREDDNERERQIVGEFSLRNRITLRNLSLLSK